MKKNPRLFVSFLLVVALPLATTCHNSSAETSADDFSNKIAKVDVCNLLSKTDVDALFDEQVGEGKPDSKIPNVKGCIWFKKNIPSLIMQVMPAPEDLRKSIDPGKGYRMRDITGLSGQSAAAIQIANPEWGLEEGVAILGISKGDFMLTLSPVKLNIKEGSTRFDKLKLVADEAMKKL